MADPSKYIGLPKEPGLEVPRVVKGVASIDHSTLGEQVEQVGLVRRETGFGVGCLGLGHLGQKALDQGVGRVHFQHLLVERGLHSLLFFVHPVGLGLLQFLHSGTGPVFTGHDHHRLIYQPGRDLHSLQEVELLLPVIGEHLEVLAQFLKFLLFLLGVLVGQGERALPYIDQFLFFEGVQVLEHEFINGLIQHQDFVTGLKDLLNHRTGIDIA